MFCAIYVLIVLNELLKWSTSYLAAFILDLSNYLNISISYKAIFNKLVE